MRPIEDRKKGRILSTTVGISLVSKAIRQMGLPKSKARVNFSIYSEGQSISGVIAVKVSKTHLSKDKIEFNLSVSGFQSSNIYEKRQHQGLSGETPT